MAIVSFIPERYEEGFSKISSISDERFDAIVEGLSYTSLAASISELSEKVAKLKNLELEEIKEILLSAASLVPLLDKEEIVEQIVDEIISIAINEKIIKSEDKEPFRYRLSVLLKNQQIYYSAKALALATEYGNVFIQARIVTDLRPIFNVNVEDVPKAALIVHNLHIHYKEDVEGDHKDLYIALDSKDIKTLKDALTRAERKENSLKIIFNKTGMTNINEEIK